jgi:predicted SAM-dependent methyltransferase
MQKAFSPFYNSPPNKKEIRYLKILRTHHANFIDFSKIIFEEYNIEKVIEIGSYLSNVAVELSKHIKSFTATEARGNIKRDRYNNWAKKNGILTDYNSINNTGIYFSKYKNEKYDAILASEILEHLPYNPITTIKSIKKNLNKKGIVIVSVPNRFSVVKLCRFLCGKHPFIFFHEFNTKDMVLNNYGHHWLEYSESDLDYVFFISGFNKIKIKKCNNKYYSNTNFYIKNIISKITLGQIYDQIYAAYQLK